MSVLLLISLTNSSGKSSLMLALFRMFDLNAGTIEIDGKDISIIPRQEVRIRLNAVPQEPYFLSGTVRLNMDPYDSLTDDTRMIQALTKVGLWAGLESKGGLDAELESDTLSHGQRQLFCLARSIIRDSKVVVLDEATSRCVPIFLDSSAKQTSERRFLPRRLT